LLAQYGQLSLNALGEMLVCETGDNPSRLVSRMVARGLVQKVKSKSDARAIVLSLTPTGRELYDVVVKPSENALHGMLESVFSDADLKNLLASLNRLSSTLGSDKAIKARISAESLKDKTL